MTYENILLEFLHRSSVENPRGIPEIMFAVSISGSRSIHKERFFKSIEAFLHEIEIKSTIKRTKLMSLKIYKTAQNIRKNLYK